MRDLSAEDFGADLVSELLGMLEVHRPPGVVEWAEANLDIPSRMSPNQPGRFSTITSPYQREVMECFHPDSGVNDLTFCAGAQVRKTVAMQVGASYRIVNAPGPILWVTPSEPFARSWSGRAHFPLIKENPVFASEMPANLDDFKLLEQHFRRCTMNLVGSNSPANLASRPVQIVICDEVGKFKMKLGDEASPVRLAEQRTKTLGTAALRAKCSTPTTVEHEFWIDYLAGSQEKYWMPCPHCGEGLIFEHRQLTSDEARPDEAEFQALQMDEEDRRYTLQWDRKAKNKDGLWSMEQVKATAFYVCPVNGCRIDDHHKAGMMLKGGYERSNDRAPKNNRSFHVNSFYSPDVTFGDMAVQFLKGRDLFGLQDYYNGYLALPWQEMSVNLRDEKILDARDMSYRRGEIPVRGGRLALKADPGEKQTHWVLLSILPDGELIVIDWGTVLRIEDMKEIQERSWELKNEPGKRLRPVGGFMDSGSGFAQRVYDFCLRSNGFWHPTKGVEGAVGGSPWNMTRVRSHPGLMLTTYSDFEAKNELYEHRLHRKFPPPVRLPGNMTADLLQGLSGQQKLEKRTPRGVMRFWKRLPEDHFGDCVKLGVVSSWVERSMGGGLQ